MKRKNILSSDEYGPRKKLGKLLPRKLFSVEDMEEIDTTLEKTEEFTNLLISEVLPTSNETQDALLMGNNNQSVSNEE